MAELALTSLIAIPPLVQKALEIIPSAIEVGWSNWLRFSRNKVIKKIATMVSVYVDETHSGKNIKKLITEYKTKVFKKFDYTELLKIYLYFKSVKEVFRYVKFNDEYWNENKVKLLTDIELMKNYLVKKSYIDTFFQKINIKLYNHSPPKEYLDEIYNEILALYMEPKYKVEDIQQFIINFEKASFKEMVKNKDCYIREFERERIVLMRLLNEANDENNIPTKFKRGNKEIVEIVSDIQVKVVVGISNELKKSGEMVEYISDSEERLERTSSIINNIKDVTINTFTGKTSQDINKLFEKEQKNTSSIMLPAKQPLKL